jgi:hypothetical protein
VDVKDKIIGALQERLNASYIRLEDEDGISGFVVSDRFAGMTTLDRQVSIDEALRNAPSPLTPAENRHVLMIAGLTPTEYDAVGANIMVFKVQQLADGGLEVLVNGGPTDAEYVRGAFKQLKGVRTTDPKQTRGESGTLMSFRAEGSDLSKDEVVRLLTRQTYVSVMPGA